MLIELIKAHGVYRGIPFTFQCVFKNTLLKLSRIKLSPMPTIQTPIILIKQHTTG